MKNEDTLEKLRSLTVKQAKVLKGISIAGGGRLNSLATGVGQEAGAVALSLENQGLIETIGRVGPYKKYAPTPQWKQTWDESREDALRILDSNIRIEDDGDPELKIKFVTDNNPQVKKNETSENWKKMDEKLKEDIT